MNNLYFFFRLLVIFNDANRFHLSRQYHESNNTMKNDLKNIVVLGSSNTDMVVRSPHLPKPGETVLGGEFMMNNGGKGANQAVAAARLGGNVCFISKIGSDVFGQKAITDYRREGINVDYVFVDDEAPSGVALILVDEKTGENSISVASGANLRLLSTDIDQATEVLEKCDILLMQLEIPIETVEYAAETVHKHGGKVVLNPAPAQPLSDELLANVDILIPNESEASILSGIPVETDEDARCAATALSDRGVDTVIMTLGSKGALVKEGNKFTAVPAHKVKAVDTTAAGDTFCGALCVAINEGQTIEEAVDFACRCSAISVTRAGAQQSTPHRHEVERQ